MAIVAEFHNGPTRVYVHDDYMVKTEEEVQKILDDLATIASRIYSRKMMEELEDETT